LVAELVVPALNSTSYPLEAREALRAATQFMSRLAPEAVADGALVPPNHL
jgi:hypothetical protein